jgi:carbon-monoxide dehydrogenase small subunit
MTQLSLTINGERVDAGVEPRTHLADFLREQCNLTGTHLGCEHGVCGACTVLLDGAPVRSCITYAVAAESATVRTVEGFPDDPVMMKLREAFTREHALQCGFCTPGMLIAAYDLVHRLPDADEARIRTELAGNICRCTGYMGIVAAIKRVIAERASLGIAPPTPARTPASAPPLPLFIPLSSRAAAAPVAAATPAAEQDTPPEEGWTRVAESFSIDHPPAEIWALLGDVTRMAACMPGATLDSHDGHTLRGRFRVRMGPIQTSFVGTASQERDDANMIGRMTGGGDEKGSSRAEGTIVYRLTPQAGGRATLVSVTMDYRLQGALAQFGRSGIVRELIGRTVAQFARNVGALADGAAPAAAHQELDAGRLVGASVWALLKAWLATAFARRDR